MQPVSETLHAERPPDKALQDSHKHQELVSRRYTDTKTQKVTVLQEGWAVEMRPRDCACDLSHNGKLSRMKCLIPCHSSRTLCSVVYKGTLPGGLQTFSKFIDHFLNVFFPIWSEHVDRLL